MWTSHLKILNRYQSSQMSDIVDCFFRSILPIELFVYIKVDMIIITFLLNWLYHIKCPQNVCSPPHNWPGQILKIFASLEAKLSLWSGLDSLSVCPLVGWVCLYFLNKTIKLPLNPLFWALFAWYRIQCLFGVEKGKGAKCASKWKENNR